MANQEHREVLKQGVSEWNEWRRQHPDIRPDLSGVNLRQANLKGINLSGAYLLEATLSEANLEEVAMNLMCTELTEWQPMSTPSNRIIRALTESSERMRCPIEGGDSKHNNCKS